MRVEPPLPAQMTVAQIIAAAEPLRIKFVPTSSAYHMKREPKEETQPQSASAFPPTFEDYSDDDDTDAYADDEYDEGWVVANDAGQELGGLALPVFDSVVADDVGDADISL